MEDISFQQTTEEVISLATIYAGNYVDFVENLPFELQRSVTRLREIDCTCREVLSEIEALYSTFTKDKDISLKRRTTLIQIQRLFCRCQELGDEKISIVQQMTETIENKKKVVEHSNYRFKSAYLPELKNEFGEKREPHKPDNHRGTKRSRRHRHHYSEKHQEKEKVIIMDTTPAVSQSTNNGHGNGSTNHSKLNLHLPLENTNAPADFTLKPKDENSSNKKSERSDKKEQSPTSSTSSGNIVTSTTPSSSSSRTSTLAKLAAAKSAAPSKSSLPGTSSNGSNKNSMKGKKKKKKTVKHHADPVSTRSPSPQVDIPVDPDEPTYCLCDQVSFGQMIGCDNKKCPIEWFHFSCVGLSHKPKGKWYCPDCSRDMKDRRKDNKKER